MKPKQTYLKGKSIFIVSLIVVGITFLTVYLTGVNYHRNLTSNLYLSLTIIATALFLFMTYGLYRGIGLIDNFPKYKSFELKSAVADSGAIPDLPSVDVGNGIGGLVLSILLWIFMSVLFFILMIFLEAVFWISLFIILAMLYWVFFRALKFVFSKSADTKDNLGMSAIYSMGYTVLYTGWIFGIVYLTQLINAASG